MFHVQRRPEACTFLKEKKFQFSVSFSMKNWDSIFSSEETISDVTHLVVMKGNEKRKNFFISHYSRRSCKHSMSILLFLGVQLSVILIKEIKKKMKKEKNTKII